MGNIIHQHCCYNHADEQNLDKMSRIIYIDDLKLRNNNTIEVEKILENKDIKKEEEKSKSKENKPSAYSTAMVSKKNSSKNIIKEKDFPEDEKYIDREIVINDKELNNQVEKIQRVFRKSLEKKIENLEQFDSIKYLNVETSNQEINNNEKRFSGSYIGDNLIIKKKEMEKDLRVSDEYTIFNTHSYNNFHDSLKNLNYSFRKNSSTITNISIPFINEISEISSLQKGNFLTKKKKYNYYGNHNIKGKKEGFGLIKWEDGSILKANFTDSKINGIASFYDSTSNSMFSGYYIDNCPKGFGIYKKDNVKIIGDSWFKNNVKKLGIEVWFDDNYYQGELNKSIKNGIGLYRWPDGTLYLGEWKNNKMDGVGLTKYSNDCVYVGEYKEGLINGWGEFLWADLKYYCGNYHNEVKEGFGIFVWNFTNLNAYVGFWENGKQNGIGIQLYNDKERIGYFKDGRRTLLLNGPWEIIDYLKPEQFKYQKFMEMNSRHLFKFVYNLKNNEILKENSVMFH